MVKEHVDEDNLTVHNLPERRDSLLPAAGGVTVVVTHAYGPAGDELVGISDVVFDDYPAVTVLVRTPDGREGLVHMSPIHGDRRKSGFVDIEPGTKIQILCPVSKRPLDELGPVDDGTGAVYHALYLTKERSDSAVVMITDIWDHYHSRIVDDSALISYWARTHPEE